MLSLLPAASPAQKSKQKPSVPAAAAKPAAVPYEIPIVTKTLANGMEVIVLPDRSVPLVTVELAVRNGSFTEPPELNGLSHLYEHMFFKSNHAMMIFGCESIQFTDPLGFRRRRCEDELRLKSQIRDVAYIGDIDNTGQVHNGETKEEVVEYYFTTAGPHLATIMKFIKDAVRFPVFDENEFEGEKEAVIAELDRHLSQPGYYLQRGMLERLFYKYPTRKLPEGTRETVAAATTDQMRLIQSRYYVPNNSALVITGDVAPERAFSLAQELFGDWEKGEDPFIKNPLVEHPPLKKSEGLIVNQPVQNVVVQIGWHGPSVGKDDAATYAADVFSFILRQPDSKFQRALVDSGITSSAGLGYYTQKNVGPIQALIVTTPDKARAAVKALYAEIDKFDSPGYYSDEELANAKTLLEADDLYGREKLSDYTHTLAFWWSTTGIDYFRGYHRHLRAVTRADISRYVSTYIKNKPHVGVALISSEDQASSGLTTADLVGGAQ